MLPKQLTMSSIVLKMRVKNKHQATRIKCKAVKLLRTPQIHSKYKAKHRKRNLRQRLGITFWVITFVTNELTGRDLGKGTFGKVKVGTHILTGEKVAVKILEKDKIVDVSDVERVAREIHILKKVRHPHVV